MEKTLAQQQQRLHGEFYSSMKTATYLSKETFSSSSKGLFASKDATDGCVVENGRRSTTTHSKCVSYESKSVTMINGQSKHFSETSMGQHFENGQETKSFIQQRVERLYGPGALAQGFFKPQKKRQCDYDGTPAVPHPSTTDVSDPATTVIRQSASSPTLPVLRHLRPEFRAQLPFISPKKGPLEGAAMPKSVTAPTLGEEKGEKVVSESKVVVGEEGVEKGMARKAEVNGRAEDVHVNGETEKNGHYFLEVLEEQSKRLLQLAARVEGDISTPDLSEEVIGKLRSAAGKAKLLVTQKMQQFKGLCANNINRSVGEAFPTTNEDLQGFWDMVMLQVDQVDAIFAEIDALRANGWQEPAPAAPKPAAKAAARPKKTAAVRPVVKPTTSAAGEESRKQREALRRKMIEERRRAMKDAQNNETRIEIFVPDGSGSSS